MADKTIGELKKATSLDDDSLLIAEQQGDAVSVTGALFKSFAQAATKGYAESASKDAATAVGAKDAAQSALQGVRDALDNLPAGDTLIINDLTTGGKSAALSAEMGKVLGYRPNPNLLINRYFANPVNQRGQTEYTGAGYTIDCWKVTGASSVLKVVDGGITFTPTATSNGIRQDIEFPEKFAGKTVTVSFLLGDANDVKARAGYGDGSNHFGEWGYSGIVTATGTVVDGATTFTAFIQFDTVAESPVVIAAKLELGSAQTLAHQDENGNWVLNEIPDYAEELAKCQRYQYVVNSPGQNSPSGYGVGLSSNSVRLTIPTPTTMRAKPTITVDCTLWLVRGNGTNCVPTEIKAASVTNSGIALNVTAEGIARDEPYMLASGSGQIIFDANL